MPFSSPAFSRRAQFKRFIFLQLLCVCNAGLGNGLSQEHVYTWLSRYASISEIIMVERKPYCFLIAGDEEGAARIACCSGSQVKHEEIDQLVEHFIYYVTESKYSC